MINRDGRGGGQFLDFMGGHSCYEGEIELMVDPPTGENLVQSCSTYTARSLSLLPYLQKAAISK